MNTYSILRKIDTYLLYQRLSTECPLNGKIDVIFCFFLSILLLLFKEFCTIQYCKCK